LGFWNGIIEVIPNSGLGSFALEIGKLKRVKGEEEVALYNKILKLALKPREEIDDKEQISLIEHYMNDEEILKKSSGKVRWIEVAKTLVQLRNRYKGHGSFMKLNEKEAALFLKPVSTLLEFILDKTIFLKKYPLIKLSAYFGEKNGKHLYECLDLSGISQIFRKFELELNIKYEPGLYFAFNREFEPPFYEVFPMALVESCACSNEGGCVKFLDSVTDKKLIYICSNCDERAEYYQYSNMITSIFSKEIPILKGMDKPYLGEEIILKERMIFGRSSKSHFVIDASFNSISRSHLEIKIENDNIYVKDLGSSNGTFINEEKLQPETFKRVKIDDIITLHKLRFKLSTKLVS
jgi:hypothetical protein